MADLGVGCSSTFSARGSAARAHLTTQPPPPIAVFRSGQAGSASSHDPPTLTSVGAAATATAMPVLITLPQEHDGICAGLDSAIRHLADIYPLLSASERVKVIAYLCDNPYRAIALKHLRDCHDRREWLRLVLDLE
jgi:hypothetical protein